MGTAARRARRGTNALQVGIVFGVVVHITDSRYAEPNRLFNAVDIAGQGMDVSVDHPWDQSVAGTREPGGTLPGVIGILSISDIDNNATTDSHVSLFDESVPREDLDVFQYEIVRFSHCQRMVV